MRRSAALVLALVSSALPLRAFAYNEAVHASLTRRALARGPLGGVTAQTAITTAESAITTAPSAITPLAPPDAAQLAAFRARFWTLASRTADASLRAKFLARFPTPESLDAWSFKELLLLNPAAGVHGFDADAPDLRPMARDELLVRASRWPDDDWRNRDRFQRGPDRQILRDAHGEPLPFDPATLALGGLTGQTSQGHAHYGLLRGPLSSDPEVLKTDPRRFALPADAQSWGAQFAQTYTDLALIARQSDLPSRAWLTGAFAGGAFHHLEDVSNQIHTIQVGIFEFFEAAFLQSKLRDAETLGGLLGPRATLKQLGLRLVSNHHLLLEDLFAKRLLELEAGHAVRPQLADALANLDATDPELLQAGRAAFEQARRGDGREAEALAYAIIDRSSLEGPDCYRDIWRLSVPTLRDGLGYAYDGVKDDDPDQFVLSSGAANEEILGHFYALEAKGTRRAVTAVRLWMGRFEELAQEPGADQRAVDRLLAFALPYQEAAAARRAAYVPSVEREQIAWGWPIAALVLIAALLALVSRLLPSPPR